MLRTVNAILVALAIVQAPHAEQTRTEVPLIISAMSIDEKGRVVCGALTANREPGLSHITAKDRREPERPSYAVSRGEGIQMEFVNVPRQARKVIIEATSIWDDALVIDVPFTLKFHWRNLSHVSISGSKILAYVQGHWGTGPSGSFSCTGDEWEQYCFPNPLAYQLLGPGSNTSGQDFEIHIASELDWIFSLEENENSNGPDLTRTILHEIGHAVGFYSAIWIDHETETAELGSPEGKTMMRYDKFIWGLHKADPVLSSLPDEPIEPRTFYKIVTEGMLLWGEWLEANQHGEPTMLAPQINRGPIFLQWGEMSYGPSHLNGFLMSSGGLDDLMTSAGGRKRTWDRIGPLTLAMLYDMGWELEPGALASTECQSLEIEQRALTNASATFLRNPDRIEVKWEINAPAEVTRVRGKSPNDPLWSEWFYTTDIEFTYANLRGEVGTWVWQLQPGTGYGQDFVASDESVVEVSARYPGPGQ